MRLPLSALAFLCLFAFPAMAQSHGGPDSIRVLGSSGYEYVSRGSVKPQAARRASKPRSTKVAGKRFTPSPSVSFHSSAAPWLADAKRYVGKGNPTSRRTLWCARFINDRLARAGKSGTGSDMAKSFLALPRTSAKPGAIAVYNRGRNPRSGHVAIVEEVSGGRVKLISANCRGGVCVYWKPVSAAIAYVWPS